VPFALLYTEDLELSAMEQRHMMRQAGGELLTAGAEGSTAEQVGAALGPGEPKPSL
jgi:import receptor subunit TOM22